MRRVTALAAGIVLSIPALAMAQEAPPEETNPGVFELGQITVTARRGEGIDLGAEALGAEAIYAFNRQTLDDAVNVMPGVAASSSGGSRNERLIFVRGFDRFQVPLSIDGIRVYLPADNRLDFGRFLTPDIAEVQVAKGYASVLDGPGALGGAINLVTRKPTKELEAEAFGNLDFDRDGGYGGYTAYARIGTAHERWYAQASFARNETDHWDLPGDYSPVPGSAEDGGERDFSTTQDWRLNVKAGFTPNDTDEYSLSYTRQEGEKNAPLHVTDPVSAQRFWTWPYWNIDSLYFLSTTALGDYATLRTRIYRNSFDNLLSAFDNRDQNSQTLGRAFNSYYKDTAWGGSGELAVNVTPANTLTVAVHFRQDKHVEFQQGFPNGLTEPKQTNVEDTYSLAVENSTVLSPALRLTLGASYDWRDLKQAEEYGTPPGSPSGAPSAIFSYPLRNVDALNGQGQLVWTPDEKTRVNASISSRARFPTIFERFSTQFGTAASNPALKPERATNYELGVSRQFGALQVEGALFYSDISDAIVSVRPEGFPANSTQRQNLGDAEYYGAEIALTAKLADTLTLGGNYTYIHRSFDITGALPGTVVPLFALTGVPEHKAFLYADWHPFAGLRIVPNVDIASDRVTSDSAVTAYYDTGSYVRANVRIDYEVAEGVELGVGARNLFDDYYVLTDGFPEAGRSFFASLRARY